MTPQLFLCTLELLQYKFLRHNSHFNTFHGLHFIVTSLLLTLLQLLLHIKLSQQCSLAPSHLSSNAVQLPASHETKQRSFPAAHAVQFSSWLSIRLRSSESAFRQPAIPPQLLHKFHPLVFKPHFETFTFGLPHLKLYSCQCPSFKCL